MKLRHTTTPPSATQNASVLIVVLWISIGLVSIALYFANSMTYELRAADNRSSGFAADQAIEGAARYVAAVLTAYATNGAMPLKQNYVCENVPIGDSHFWIIGRDPSGAISSDPYFGLIDEGSKLNLNRAGTNTLYDLSLAVPDMSSDFAMAITDWRSTNGTLSLDYSQYGYEAKHDAFESVDELRLVSGATIDLLVGDDINRNGVIDSNEKDSGSLGQPATGLLEYLTVYTREPNYHSDGSALTNVNSERDLRALLESALGSSRAPQILRNLGFTQNGQNPPTFSSIIHFYLTSQMTADEFAKISDNITTTTNSQFIRGRVNVNTASEPVLTALFMGIGAGQNDASGAAQTLVDYRTQHPDNLATIAWIVDALGSSHPVLQQLNRAARDYVTTKTFQFTADIAAVGPFGRGYRRVKFVFDISEGAPKILYRQDLTRLGWALGDKARETDVASNSP